MSKLLFFASDYSIGLSVLLTDQLCALYGTNIDICAVASETEQEIGLYQKISNLRIPIIRVSGLDKHRNFKLLTSKIVSIVQEQNIDIIHVQNNWQLALISFVKFRLLFDRRLKVVYTLHAFRHNSPLKSVMARFIIGFSLFLFADKVICMCSYLKEKFWFLSRKIVVLPLGIADDFFMSEYTPLPDSGLQLVFPAQFRKGKNQDILIRAFAKYVSETNDTQSKLVLPGSGPLLEKMKQLSESLQVKERIVFPGQCTKQEIREWYLKSNIGVVASNCETFGQSIVEPYILGRCVITTHVGVAIDIIKEKSSGFFFSDEKMLVSIFKTLHNHPTLIKEIGMRNYNASSQFRWNNIALRYKRLIME